MSVILAFVGLNLLYVAFACPFDLSPDEAHYWDWSRRLDYCYYSKGPLVAILIRGSTELLGHTAFAVRLPAVLCGGLLLLGLHRLTLRATADERLSLCVVLVCLTLPPVAAGSVLMTIDPPFLACWVWACVLLVPGPQGSRQLASAGLLVALGTLAKPTMLLLPACVLLWMIATKQRFTRGYAIFFAVSGLGLVPVVVWNANHDWVSVRHLLGHAGEGEPWSGANGVLGYLGAQLGLLLGVWLVLWLLAVGRQARAKTASIEWWLSVPVFAAFLFASIRTNSQPNWPMPAYLTGAVLVAVWVKERWANRYLHRAVWVAIGLGLAFGVVVRFPGLVRPFLAELVSAPSDQRLAPVRQLDPTARLCGWRYLAERVDAIRERVRTQTGHSPLLATMTWTGPGELGFYCAGNPRGFSFGSALADRYSQYDVWRPNPVADAQDFLGYTFVYVGEAIPETAFSKVELAEVVVAREYGIPVANWRIWVCYGFRGFSPRDPNQHPARH